MFGSCFRTLAAIPVSEFGIFFFAFPLCLSPYPLTHHRVFHWQDQFGFNLHVTQWMERRKESTGFSLSPSSLDFNVTLLAQSDPPGSVTQIETNDT